MPTSSNRRDKARSWPLAILAVAAVPLGLLLYVLGVGPAVFMLDRGYLSQSAYLTLYAPLTWFYEAVEPVQPILDWYAEWWI